MDPTHVSKSLVILLLEDNADDAFLFIKAARGQELSVLITVAENGEKGLFWLQRAAELGTLPDLIVTDIKMPRCDGFDFTQLLRRDQRFARIPVCFLSSSTEEKDVIRAYAAGGSLYIVKPMGFHAYNDLFRILERYATDPASRQESTILQVLRTDSGKLVNHQGREAK